MMPFIALFMEITTAFLQGASVIERHYMHVSKYIKYVQIYAYIYVPFIALFMEITPALLQGASVSRNM
jgi:ammonia channel protein AmtB